MKKNFENMPCPDVSNAFLGSMTQLRKEKINFFIKQKKNLGDVYRIKVPTRKVVVVSNPEWIKYVLVDNNKNYTKSFAYDSIRLFLGNGLLTSEGDYWKRQRRLAQPAFHKERLQLMFRNMLEQTEKCLQRLEKFSETGERFNLSDELYKLTLDIVNSTLFYSEIESTTGAIYKLVSEGSEFITRRIDNPFQLPNWVPTPHNWREKRVLHSMDDVFFSIIDRRRKNKEHHDDLLSMLMEAKDEETGEGMTNRQLRDEILTIFVAGHETTQIALGWTFYLLSMNKDKMKILSDEIDDKITGDTIMPEQIRSLPYLKQVIDESMRCYPPAWVMGRRTIEKDSIDGYEIPPYTNVVMPIYVVHHDESIWENPYAFEPERFAPDKLKDKHKYAYFPFGGGPRLCIGNNFALQEMQVVLTKILQRFTIEVDKDFIPEMDPLITLRPKHPIYAKVWKRK